MGIPRGQRKASMRDSKRVKWKCGGGEGQRVLEDTHGSGLRTIKEGLERWLSG